MTGHDMNILPAWKKGITGKNVVITILDDGVFILSFLPHFLSKHEVGV